MGDFSRMAEHEFKLLADASPDADTPPSVPDSQLALPFAGQEQRPSPLVLPPEHSQRRLRGKCLGRNLLAPKVAHSLEELRLERTLANHLPPGKVLSLRLTENRYTIVSVKRGRECYQVRAHRMFADAEPRLVRALARYVVHNDANASEQLSAFIERNQHRIKKIPPRTRRIVLRTRGRVHDLGAVFERLNQRFFEGKLDARITWGAARGSGPRRSIKVGTYVVEDRLIRVNPVLDQARVPGFFVDWIVFHEMLHGKHEIRRVAGRRSFHPPEFTRDERLFPDYERARTWEKANLELLLG